ncbi:PREDICTED: putative E3 ubiquitin-protein ligase RING1a isoform X1 [Populus euphratica]|uniref:E3 ubiquitin-protein ligase RING1a isoform X1 n=1 Tax=Populus euphratica TaxID=75702 RepID=A0AAJ6UE91_POPEU|nr:PREDICTED: putative E3 ubiquitin-protein ligase RING1a isoform X1 [Populus euphratica]
MPAQKRSHETLQKEDDDALIQQQQDHTNNNNDNNNNNNHEQKQQPQDDIDGGGGGGVDEQSDRSQSSSSINEDVKEEYVVVKLSEIRKEVQCPICLGIIRKTRTVMECLHRFCRECIDKSMRLGNNECPACRTHCASRRSLRDDPNYDALISALYPDIDKYEEEELAFQEDEKARNKQIQATIAQTFHRQAEALSRKKTTPKVTAAAFARRTPSRFRDAHSRGRRNYRMAGFQGSDDNEDANGDGGKDSSSADEHSAEVKPKRCKKWVGARSAAVNADGGGDENDSEVNKESVGGSSGLVGSSERLAWGKNGMRSHTRYGSANSSNVKNARSSRISKLADYLRNLEGNDNELDINLMLVSFDEQRVPSLQRPYLCCRPTLSINKLCQYVAFQTSLQANEVEIYLVREMNSMVDFSISMSTPISKPGIIDPCKDKLQVLEEQETLGRLETNNFIHGHLLLAYRKKV